LLTISRPSCFVHGWPRHFLTFAHGVRRLRRSVSKSFPARGGTGTPCHSFNPQPLMNSPNPFYTVPSLHVEVYDELARTGWNTLHDDFSFYSEELASVKGPVLELACGTGRVLVPMLASGLEIHGLDASDAMLSVLRAKRDALPADQAKRLHLHKGDMAQFDLGQKFGLIVIAFRTFQAMLNLDAQRRCLTCIRKHLARDGRVIISLFDPRHDLILPGKQKPFQPIREVTNPVTGLQVRVEVLDRENFPLTQTLREHWRFTEHAPDGSIVRECEEDLTLRWIFRAEMRLLVESCGFVVDSEYSDYLRTPPAYGREQVWILRGT